MAYPRFDMSRLGEVPAEAISGSIEDLVPLAAGAGEAGESIESLGSALLKAREQGAAVVFLVAGRVLAAGTSRVLVDLLEHGLITHLALELDAASVDWQLATTGRFQQPLVEASDAQMTEIIFESPGRDEGAGERLGRRLIEEPAPHADISVLAQAWRWGIPATVHAASEQPGVTVPPGTPTDGRELLVLAHSVESLELGVLCQLGRPALSSRDLVVRRDPVRTGNYGLHRCDPARSERSRLVGRHDRRLPAGPARTETGHRRAVRRDRRGHPSRGATHRRVVGVELSWKGQ